MESVAIGGSEMSTPLSLYDHSIDEFPNIAKRLLLGLYVLDFYDHQGVRQRKTLPKGTKITKKPGTTELLIWNIDPEIKKRFHIK